MSHTFKDAPDARRAVQARRFARAERPLPPAAVPADPWESFADPGLSRASRLAAAEFLGLSGVPTEKELADAPCPHAGLGTLALAVLDPDPGTCCVPAGVLARAELTAIANDF